MDNIDVHERHNFAVDTFANDFEITRKLNISLKIHSGISSMRCDAEGVIPESPEPNNTMTTVYYRIRGIGNLTSLSEAEICKISAVDKSLSRALGDFEIAFRLAVLK